MRRKLRKKMIECYIIQEESINTVILIEQDLLIDIEYGNMKIKISKLTQLLASHQKNKIEYSLLSNLKLFSIKQALIIHCFQFFQKSLAMKRINNFLQVPSSKPIKQDQYLLSQTASFLAINLKTGITILSQNSIIKLIPNSELITPFNKFILNNIAALPYSKYSHLPEERSRLSDQSQIEIFFIECKLKILQLLQILTLYVESNNYNLPEKLISFSCMDKEFEKTVWVQISKNEENTEARKGNKLKQIISDEIIFRLNKAIYHGSNLNQNYQEITKIILKEINIKEHQNCKSQILRIKSIVRGLKFQQHQQKKQSTNLMGQLQLNLNQNRSCQKYEQVSYNRKENKIGNEQSLRLSLKNAGRKKSYKLLKEKSTKRKGSTLNPCRNSFAELKKSLNNDNYLKNTFNTQKEQNSINYLAGLQEGCLGHLIPHLSLSSNHRASRQKSKQQKEHIRQIRQDIMKQFKINLGTEENKKSKGELQTEETQKYISENTDAKENEIFVANQRVQVIQKSSKVFPKKIIKEISNRLEETIDPIGQAIPLLRKQLKNTAYKSQLPLYLLYKKFLYLRAAFLSVIYSENAPTQLFPEVTQQEWEKQIVKRQYVELVKKIEDENESINEGLSILHKKICKNKEDDSKLNIIDKEILQIVIEDQKVYEEFVKQMFMLNFQLLKKISQNSEIEHQNRKQIFFVYSRVLITAIHDDLLEHGQITPSLKQKLMQYVSKHQTFSTSQTFSLLTQIASLFSPQNQ